MPKCTTLRIPGAQRSDTGQYELVLTNEAGSDKVPIKITVMGGSSTESACGGGGGGGVGGGGGGGGVCVCVCVCACMCVDIYLIVSCVFVCVVCVWCVCVWWLVVVFGG